MISFDKYGNRELVTVALSGLEDLPFAGSLRKQRLDEVIQGLKELERRLAHEERWIADRDRKIRSRMV